MTDMNEQQAEDRRRKLISLDVENVLRVKCVHLDFSPEGGLTVVGGKNGAGKTSVLKALEHAFAGKRAIGDEPLRRGADKGYVVVELDDMIVRREFGPGGKTRLTVTAKDGTHFSSQQEMLKRLVGHFAFDPLEFIDLPAVEQAERLRELLGLDFSKLDADRAEFYEKRTMIGRDRDSLQGQLDGLPFHEDAPEEPVIVSELIARRDRLVDINSSNRAERERLESFRQTERSAIQIIEARTGEVQRAKAAVKEAQERLQSSIEDAQSIGLDVAKQQQKVDGMRDRDLAPITEQIEAAEETNALVRANQARANVEKRSQQADAEYAAMTKEIAEIDRRKKELLAAAEFPVAGLGFSDAGVTLNGFEFAVAGGAEKLAVAMAIGIKTAGDLPLVSIDKGEQLDDESLDLVRTMADEAGAWVVMSKVSLGAECTVVLEDGQIREFPAETPA